MHGRAKKGSVVIGGALFGPVFPPKGVVVGKELP